MANNNSNNKNANKSGIIDITIEEENQTEFAKDETANESFALFKEVFGRSSGALMKTNLLVLLFALPALAVVFFFVIQQLQLGYFLAFSGNIGVGYPVAVGASELAEYYRYVYQNMMYIWLLPCMLVVSFGFAGAFYVVKKLLVGDVAVCKNFFSGIKKNIVQILISTVMLSISAVIMLLYINNYSYINIASWLNSILFALSILQFAIVVMMSIFMFTQSVSYNLKLSQIIKNSFLFAVAFIPSNIIILALSAIPAVLLYFTWDVDLINMIVIIACLLFLFSFIILIWTVYSNWVFSRCISEKSKSTNKQEKKK